MNNKRNMTDILYLVSVQTLAKIKKCLFKPFCNLYIVMTHNYTFLFDVSLHFSHEMKIFSREISTFFLADLRH